MIKFNQDIIKVRVCDRGGALPGQGKNEFEGPGGLLRQERTETLVDLRRHRYHEIYPRQVQWLRVGMEPEQTEGL